jgi:hypothetical protein
MSPPRGVDAALARCGGLVVLATVTLGASVVVAVVVLDLTATLHGDPICVFVSR